MMATRRNSSKKLKTHLSSKGASDVVITPTLISYWFHILNAAAFNNKLPFPQNIIVRPMNGAWGYCVGYTRTKNCVITISSRIKNKSLLLSTLAHEMSHQYQWVFGECIDHGNTFRTWKEYFRKQFSLVI